MDTKQQPFTNYWNKYPKNSTKTQHSNDGTKSVFSTAPKVGKIGRLILHENAIFFKHPEHISTQNEPPERIENDIKNFSPESRKKLFNIFNSLQYSEYGLPIFISATWHYDAPGTRAHIKTFLANFVRDLKYHLEPFHAIWKLEYQKRGTPHFHFILLPLNKKSNLWSEANEKIIKTLWLKKKSCKCKHCKEYAIKTVKVETYKMAISYISKEIAKVQDTYEDHDMGRVWGSSQNLRMSPVMELDVPIEVYHKIIDRKLEEYKPDQKGREYLLGLKWLTQNSSVFISIEKVRDLLIKFEPSTNYKKLNLKKYSLKRFPTEHLKTESA